MRLLYASVLLLALAAPTRAQWVPLSNQYTVVFGGQSFQIEAAAFSLGTLGGQLVATSSAPSPNPSNPYNLATRDETAGRWVYSFGPTFSTPQFPTAAFAAGYLDGPVRTSRGVFFDSDGSGFYRVTGEGASYTRITPAQGLPPTYPDRGSGASNNSRLWLRGEAGGALWISGYDGLYRSTDGGALWTKVTVGLPPFKNLMAASFDRYDDAVVHTVAEEGGALFAAIARGLGSTKTRGGLFRSADGGTSWARVSGGLPDSADVYTFFRAGGRILASTVLITANASGNPSGYSFALYASADGGAMWSPESFPLANGIGGCPLAFERIGTAIVAACTVHINGPHPVSGGVWTSLDEGATWTDVAANLPRPTSRGNGVTVGDVMAFGPDLYVIQNTDGVNDQPSVWRRPLAGLGIAPTAAAPAPSADALQMSASPNPARSAATLRVSLAEAQTVRVTLTDVLGREVLALDRALPAGASALPLDVSGLAPGVYVARLVSNGAQASVRLTVTR